MHVAFVTTYFPNSLDPHRAVFVRNLAQAMLADEAIDISVISPVADYLYLRQMRGVQDPSVILTSDNGSIPVNYPNYFVVPKFEWLQPYSYYWAILGQLKQLAARHPQLVLHAHRIHPDGVAAVMAARKLGLKVVLTAHGTEINRENKPPGVLGQIRYALRHADGVIGVSQPLIKKMIEIHNRDYALIPCAGFNAGVFNLNAERRSDHFSVLFVGNILKSKGVIDLVQAWKRLQDKGALAPEDRLIFIGAGPDKTQLERDVKQLGLTESVQLAGALVQSEVANWLQRVTLLSLPSYMEGLPNVIIEALACGTAVVASEVGGIPQVIKPGLNGEFHRPGDVEGIANALLRGKDLQASQAQLADTVKEYRWDDLAQRNVALIKSLVGG